jgi:hypothetical protein
MKLRCNKHRANTERSTPPLVEENVPLLNTYMSSREQETWSQISKRPEAKNDCVGDRSTEQPTELVAVSVSCEAVAARMIWKTPGDDMGTEAKGSPLLGSVTRQRLVKIITVGYLACAVVRSRVRELSIMLRLLVVISVISITYPNPVSSH